MGRGRPIASLSGGKLERGERRKDTNKGNARDTASKGGLRDSKTRGSTCHRDSRSKHTISHGQPRGEETLDAQVIQKKPWDVMCKIGDPPRLTTANGTGLKCDQKQ